VYRVGRALLQEAGGEEAKPSGIAGWNPRTHGYTVAISFGIVMPFAAIISRGFRVRSCASLLESECCWTATLQHIMRDRYALAGVVLHLDAVLSTSASVMQLTHYARSTHHRRSTQGGSGCTRRSALPPSSADCWA
jgi:hypothetical protein